MPRRTSLKDILLRKTLLITEAEVHREQMRHDLQIIGQGLDGLGRKARSVGTVASVIGLVVGGFTALRGVRKSSPHRKTSLVSRLFSGVRLASTLWQGWNSIQHSHSLPQAWNGRGSSPARSASR